MLMQYSLVYVTGGTSHCQLFVLFSNSHDLALMRHKKGAEVRKDLSPFSLRNTWKRYLRDRHAARPARPEPKSNSYAGSGT